MVNTIVELVQIMRSFGATKFYAKLLAPNDNSKNQIYLGSDFSALNVIPYSHVSVDDAEIAGSKRDRAKADISFFWIDQNGKYAAPNAKLILYPKYPEIRMSGFLQGCANPPSNVIASRSEGRVLFLGITPAGDVLGFATGPEDLLSKQAWARPDWTEKKVFVRFHDDVNLTDTKSILLEALENIYRKFWIQSQKLGSDGLPGFYKARNGGGYTLEAELGISPNGYADPDYLGWEVKQYGVRDFEKFLPKSPVTLMTPEPTAGIYREKGVLEFMIKFGYPDKSGKIDRVNFGGVYGCGKDYHTGTGLKLVLEGFDVATGKITDLNGGIALVDQNGEVAALWKYSNMIEHWNRKHAQAVYVPSLFRSPPPEYKFGPQVLLCEKTDFLLFLRAVAGGVIYYDPAIKVERFSTSQPKIKRRNQFRVKHGNLTQLYYDHEVVDLRL